MPLDAIAPLVVSATLVAAPPPAHDAWFESGAVACDHPTASEAGARMLRRGGNAVDAAVAASFTLSVVRPMSCGIGGGGFMVIHLPADPTHGEVTTAINYRETAPAAVGPDYYSRDGAPENASTRGGTAVGVPGTVAGLLHALDAYGTLDRETVLAPAIHAAEAGWTIDGHAAESLARLKAWYDEQPARTQRFPFLWETYLHEGKLAAGETITLPGQARALRRIAQDGAAPFYEGPIAHAIIEAVTRTGGDMTPEDLAGYEPLEVDPIAFDVLGHTILTMPPPSSGGVAMCQILGVLERLRPWEDDFERGTGPPIKHTPHVYIEAMKHAFADRAEWMGDPRFVDIPIERLLSHDSLDEFAARIDTTRTFAPDHYGSRAAPPDDDGTSHLSVVDQWGGAVACTETINTPFGSLVGVGEYGFVLNNEMDDFTARPGEPNTYGLIQSARNAPAPGKRPLSSMTPTIVLDEERRVVTVAGAAGGPRIISATTQCVLATTVFGVDAGPAITFPRLHHQWLPNVVYYERTFPAGELAPALDVLRETGHELRERDVVGVVQLITRGRDREGWNAASDPRRGGSPAGH